jgi:hypothetical protein
MRITPAMALLVTSHVVRDTFPVDVHMGVDDERPAVGADDEPGRANPRTGDRAARSKL